MSARILHVLSQRPSRTGSGVTLDSLVRLSAREGWEQAALVGVPVTEVRPVVGDLPPDRIHAVRFADPDTDAAVLAELPTPDLDFPVPGMSDVMPYRSSVWSQLDGEQLARYREVWRRRLAEVVAEFEPDLIHANHVWLVASLVKEIAPDIPALTTCHATGLRQMELCPHLKQEVVRGCRRLDRFCVLREDHRDRLAEVLEIPTERVIVTGVGYRDEIFHQRGAAPAGKRAGQLLYVGKYSAAKGLPWLLNAVERIAADRPEIHLHVAGSGAGAEADHLRARMAAMTMVTMHGQLDQPALADLARRCAVCVLPSFYEGVPLVLVEAAACDCRIVATDLPGVRGTIAPALGDLLTTVPMPRLRGVDTPREEDLPRFVEDLSTALIAVSNPAPGLELSDGPDGTASVDPDRCLEPFTWTAVQQRVGTNWRDLLP